MIKEKSKKKSRPIAFVLTLALGITCLFGGMGMPSVGQLTDREAWANEVYGARGLSAPTTTISAVDAGIEVVHNTGNGGSIFANGKPIIIREGTNTTTNATICIDNNGELKAVDLGITGGDPIGGYDIQSNCYSIYGGASSAAVTVASTSITMTGGTVWRIIGGGGTGSAITGDTSVTISGGTVAKLTGENAMVVGGGYHENATVGGNTNVSIGGIVTVKASVYGGGFTSGAIVEGNTHVTIGDGVESELFSFYGGRNQGIVKGNTNVTVNGSTLNSIYGSGVGKYMGASEGAVVGDTNIIVNGGTINNPVRGSGSSFPSSSVGGSSNITINGGMITKGVYSACTNYNTTASTTSITINGGTIGPTSGTSIDGKTDVTNGTNPVIINGGSISGTITSKTTSPNPAYTNGAGKALYKVEVALQNGDGQAVSMAAVKAISGIGDYGVKDIQSDKDGKIYLYLTAGSSITQITAGGNIYKPEGNIGVGTGGTVTSGTAIYAGQESSGGGNYFGGGSSSKGNTNEVKTTANVKEDTATAEVKADVLKNADTITVKSTFGDVEFDSKATDSIQSQAGSEDLSVSIKKVEADSLDDSVKAIVGNTPIYDFSIKAGNKSITSFGGGNVIITLPYELLEGQKESLIGAYYVDEKGKLYKMSNIKYNHKEKTVSFTATHFSMYMAKYDGETPKLFIDVKAGDWYYEAVNYVVEKGLLEGTSDTEFSPNAPMTRAMLTTVLYRHAGSPAQASTSQFTDIKAGLWYSDSVFWAANKGIVNGFKDVPTDTLYFAPNQNITREQMAVILYNYNKSTGQNVTTTGEGYTNYPDAAFVSDWATDGMTWAVNEKIISGKDTGKLDPKGQATRAEVSAILMRMLEE